MDTIAKIKTRGVSIDFKKLADVQIPRYNYTCLLISNVHKNITSLRNYHSRKNVYINMEYYIHYVLYILL